MVRLKFRFESGPASNRQEVDLAALKLIELDLSEVVIHLEKIEKGMAVQTGFLAVVVGFLFAFSFLPFTLMRRRERSRV